ncbi:MAG: hypothetical protein ACK4TB_15155 [Gemmobacter sp.]
MGQPSADPDLPPRAAAAALPCAGPPGDCAAIARLRRLAPEVDAGLSAVCGPDAAAVRVLVDVPCRLVPSGLGRIAARFDAGRVDVRATAVPRVQ